MEDSAVARVALLVPWVVAAAALTADAQAQAQANLDAGKSAAQIFADTCNACHRSPREIRPTSAAFLREHYTTGAREAAAMAAYLASVGSDTRAVQQRRPPTLGAGQAAAPGSDQGNGRRTSEQGQPSPSLREHGSGQSADLCRAGRRARGSCVASCRGDTGTAERNRRLRGIALRRRWPQNCAPFLLRAFRPAATGKPVCATAHKRGCPRAIGWRFPHALRKARQPRTLFFLRFGICRRRLVCGLTRAARRDHLWLEEGLRRGGGGFLTFLAGNGDVLAASEPLGLVGVARDGDADRHFDLGMQRNRHLVQADRLDRRVERDLGAIDRKAFLRDQRR